MKKLILFLLIASNVHAQSWSSILDSSRAIDWTQVGFTIPNYVANCSTQPSLATGAGNAAANTTAIQNALNSCDSTHNVVHIPSGTYYVAGWTYGSQGKQVVRGNGPMATYLYITNNLINMVSNPATYGGDSSVLPPSGARQCAWTAGYAKGTTTITLSTCGGAPPLNQTIILDQINDAADTNGLFICDNTLVSCAQEAGPGDNEGRKTGGITRNSQQVVYTTGVSSLGGGSYSVTISPGVYFNNIRSGQQPGVWWPGFVQNDGIENLTLDYSTSAIADNGSGAVQMYNCYQCWMSNVRSLYGLRNSVFIYQSTQDIIKNSYFYQTKNNHHASEAYCIEATESSNVLVVNNIFQQQTNPVLIQNGSGFVVAYNFSVDNVYGSPYMQASYYNHNGGVEMNLWEGNSFNGIWADDIHGASASGTLFRNLLSGWQTGTSSTTIPIILRTHIRAFNVIGNILGQPSYHNHYQSYATSSSTISGGTENTAIYSLGLAGEDTCSDLNIVQCDTLSPSTLMRWGNYDTVNANIRWDSTESSPSTVPYVNANSTPSNHTLPNSMYYNSTPAWWPIGKIWPPIGPDVSLGNLGICTGTYAGAQAISSSQCTGGTLNSAWSGHVNSIPAQDCYLNIMNGPPNGTGSVLNFDASSCYSVAPPTIPAKRFFVIAQGDIK